MAYLGEQVTIPLGTGGLRTDQHQSEILPNYLIEATNVSLYNNIIEKEKGSARWNTTALGTGIVAGFNWKPSTVVSRTIVIGADGKVYRFKDKKTSSEVTADGSAPTTLTVTNPPIMVSGGGENASRAKKLFMFTGNNPVQVISGDGTTRNNIANPAADWSGTNQPKGGLIYRSRLAAFGNANDPHRLYLSDDDDHEEFTSGFLQFPVFSGEGDGILGAAVFLGRLFIFKQPRGVYYLEDSDSNTANWFVQKLSDRFGAKSPQGMLSLLQDLLVADNEGSIVSARATEKFGSFDFGDIFDQARVERYIRSLVSNRGDRFAIYDKKNRTAIFTYQSAGGKQNDSAVRIDFSDLAQPKITFSQKDQTSSIWVQETSMTEEKIFYGAADGFIYETDREDREILKVFRPGTLDAALAGSGAGNLSNGSYRYKITFYDDTNESDPGAPSNAVTVADNSTDGQVALTNIPVDSTSTATKRRIYRTLVDGELYYHLADIADNTTTTYTDNIADGSLDTAVSPPDKNTFNTSYESRFMTPHMDFAFQDPRLAGLRKNFDFLEIDFYPTGAIELLADIFIDGKFLETLTFTLTRGPVLDQFVLDQARFLGGVPFNSRRGLHGSGFRIAIRFRHLGLRENFKVAACRVYFRLGNQNQVDRFGANTSGT